MKLEQLYNLHANKNYYFYNEVAIGSLIIKSSNGCYPFLLLSVIHSNKKCLASVYSDKKDKFAKIFLGKGNLQNILCNGCLSCVLVIIKHIFHQIYCFNYYSTYTLAFIDNAYFVQKLICFFQQIGQPISYRGHIKFPN